MFWVTDSERVIDDRPTQPYSMTMEKWKERKEVMEFLNGRGWTYHGMSAYARKTRTSVLNRHRQKLISDKHGVRYDMPPYVRRPYGRRLYAEVPKATFSLAMALMDKVGGWKEEWVGANFVACMWICGRRSDPPLYLESILGIIVEGVTWVT